MKLISRIYTGIAQQFLLQAYHDGRDSYGIYGSFLRMKETDRHPPSEIRFYCSSEVNHSLVFNAVNKALHTFTATFEQPISFGPDLWKYTVFVKGHFKESRLTIFVKYTTYLPPFEFISFKCVTKLPETKRQEPLLWDHFPSNPFALIK